MSKARIFFVVLLIGMLLAISVVYSGWSKTPSDDVEDLTVRISFKGYATLKEKASDYNIGWLAISTLNYPETTKNQEVLAAGASEPHVVKVDEYGNHYLELNFSDPVIGKNEYEVWAIIKRRKQTPEDIELGTAVIPSIFTTNTTLIESNDIEIRGLANELITDPTSYESVGKVTSWVHNNIVYDPAYEDVSNSAKWTLDNKRGVCVEFSHLELALLRSKNIAARHVYGVAPYNFPEGWQEHTWVEAFLGAWVPMDPTWNKKGALDATHIKYAALPDQSFVEERALVSGISLELTELSLPEMTVEVVDVTYAEKGLVEKLLQI